MKAGQPLVDVERGSTDYRVSELIAEGEHYQIACGLNASKRKVAFRAISYGEDWGDDQVEQRRRALRRQWDFLEDTRQSKMTPEPLDFLQLADSPVEPTPEPLVVCEYVEGPDLYSWVTGEFPQGMAPERVLTMADEIAEFLETIHGEKWLFRDFDPRRFVVDADGERIVAVSLGNISKWGRALEQEQLRINAAYVAPEVRDEVSGSMQRPAADLYGLGALLSFLLTGEEPRPRVESPLSYGAYERIQSLELPGLELLLARLLQPLAKKRIGRAKRLRPYLSVDNLPSREDRGFEMAMLPAPWLGLEIDDPGANRALRSKLSAGPLVSVDSAQQKGDEDVHDDPRRVLDWPLLIAVLVIAVALIAAAIFLLPLS